MLWWVERCKLKVKEIYNRETVEPFKLGHVLMCMWTKENVYSDLENHTLLMTESPVCNNA